MECSGWGWLSVVKDRKFCAGIVFIRLNKASVGLGLKTLGRDLDPAPSSTAFKPRRTHGT